MSVFKGKQEAGIQTGHYFNQRQLINLRRKADFQETRLLAKKVCLFHQAFKVCLEENLKWSKMQTKGRTTPLLLHCLPRTQHLVNTW